MRQRRRRLARFRAWTRYPRETPQPMWWWKVWPSPTALRPTSPAHLRGLTATLSNSGSSCIDGNEAARRAATSTAIRSSPTAPSATGAGSGIAVDQREPDRRRQHRLRNVSSRTAAESFSLTSPMTAAGSTFSGNSAAAGVGGLLINSAGFSVTMERCTVSGNTAGWGGGIPLDGGSLSVLDSAITGNSATSQDAGDEVGEADYFLRVPSLSSRSPTPRSAGIQARANSGGRRIDTRLVRHISCKCDDDRQHGRRGSRRRRQRRRARRGRQSVGDNPQRASCPAIRT